MKRFAYLLPLIAGTGWGCTGLFVRTLDDAGFDNITITVEKITPNKRGNVAENEDGRHAGDGITLCPAGSQKQL